MTTDNETPAQYVCMFCDREGIPEDEWHQHDSRTHAMAAIKARLGASDIVPKDAILMMLEAEELWPVEQIFLRHIHADSPEHFHGADGAVRRDAERLRYGVDGPE